MSIVRAAEDPWTREMQKWERRDVRVGGTFVEALPRAAGGKKDLGFEEYPKMLFRAESANGGPQVSDFIIVGSKDEQRLQEGRGFKASQQAALDDVVARELEIAKLAANRAFFEQRMSAKAQAEANAYDEQHAEHLGEIPVKPIKRRGRAPGYKVKPKAAATAAEGSHG